jgi:hypothetical protein
VVECQLPKLDVAGSSPVSRSSFQTLRNTHRFLVTPFTPLSPVRSSRALQGFRFSKHRGFEFVHCFALLLQVGIGVHLHADAKAMTPLVGCDLGVTPYFLERLALVFRRI